jgi:hypothetical protein
MRFHTAHFAARLRAAAIAAVVATLAACGGGGDSTGPGAVDDDTPRTDVPSQLAADWLYGSISPTNFWDDHTGQYSGNAYGFSDYVMLEADGTYKRYIYIYTQYYGCRTQSYTYHVGTVTVNGSTITYYPQQGKYKATDNCVDRRNFERAMTRDEVIDAQGDAWDWELGTDLNGQTVLLAGPAGSGEQATYRLMD